MFAGKQGDTTMSKWTAIIKKPSIYEASGMIVGESPYL